MSHAVLPWGFVGRLVCGLARHRVGARSTSRRRVPCGVRAAWLVATVAAGGPAQAEPAACVQAALGAEQEAGLPAGLLGAIGIVETGQRNPATGRTEPWPWSTNLGGVGHFFASKTEAIAWTAAQRAMGQTSIDVGCFQINLKYHPDAFANLEDAFDPVSNARYAAVFLTGLYRRLGRWTGAAEYYHSADPALGEPYGRRVMALIGHVLEAPGSPAEPSPALRSFPAQLTRFAMQVIIPNWAQSPGGAPARPTVRSVAYLAPPGRDGSRRAGLRLPTVYRP